MQQEKLTKDQIGIFNEDGTIQRDKNDIMVSPKLDVLGGRAHPFHMRVLLDNTPTHPATLFVTLPPFYEVPVSPETRSRWLVEAKEVLS